MGLLHTNEIALITVTLLDPFVTQNLSNKPNNPTQLDLLTNNPHITSDMMGACSGAACDNSIQALTH